MTEPSDDEMLITIPAFIPVEGLGKYIEEMTRRIARDLALPADCFEERRQTKAAPARPSRPAQTI